jgi:membrane protein required for colicin V production
LNDAVKLPQDLAAGLSAMIWVDYGLLGLIALSALMGLFRGLIREVFSLAVWGLAIWLGLHYCKEFSVYLEAAIPLASARTATAFFGIFVATLLVGGMLGAVLNKLFASAGLSGTDRLAGLVFGIARGVLFAALLILMAGLTPLPSDPWWKESKLIPPLQSLALMLRDQLPAGVAGNIKYR